MSKAYNQKTMCTLGCCHSMLASFLCLLNLVSLAVGGILIGTGIYGFVKMENYFLIMGDEYLFTSSILTGIGATILVIGFFGCCGTCTETSWMIKIYRYDYMFDSTKTLFLKRFQMPTYLNAKSNQILSFQHPFDNCPDLRDRNFNGIFNSE